jgi:large conductance mechanosensitive channel
LAAASVPRLLLRIRVCAWLSAVGRSVIPLPVSDPACLRNQEEGVSMSLVSEFKEFALKGSVMDLAVGVIIGGAFGKIVDSIVNDLIMPLVSKATGGLDFSNYYIGLTGQQAGLPLAEAKKVGAVFAYGNFITVLIYFIILAFIIFMMIKQVNKLKKQAPPAPAEPPEDVLLLRQIRDSLRK